MISVLLADVIVTTFTSYAAPELSPLIVTAPSVALANAYGEHTLAAHGVHEESEASLKETSYLANTPPPKSAGWDHVADTEETPGRADRLVTAYGLVTGVTGIEEDEADPAPTLFVAATVRVYEVPFTRLLMVQASGETDAEQSYFTTVVPLAGVATTL